MAAALEGAVNQHQGDGESSSTEPVSTENWSDDLFTPDMEQLGFQWEFPPVDTDSLLHDVVHATRPSYGSSSGSTTTGSDSVISLVPMRPFDDLTSPEAGNGLIAFEDPNGPFAINVSSLMQAEL
jgi:hypothetical protein